MKQPSEGYHFGLSQELRSLREVNKAKPRRYADIRGEKERPPVVLEFLFGAHMTEGDAEGFAKKIEEADVYIPEAAGWHEYLPTLYQAIADGNISQSAFDSVIDTQIRAGQPFSARELTLLRDSGKKILLVDIPDDHPAHLMSQELAHLRRNAMEAFLDGDYASYLALLKQSFSLQEKATTLREQFIQKRIHEELPLLCDRFPELTNKKEIRVAAFLGAGHTDVHHQVKSDNPLIAVRWSIPDLVHSLQAEIPRRLKKHLSVDEILYARYFVTQVLTNYMLGVTSQDYNEVTAVVRFIASKLSLVDIKEITTRMGGTKNIDAKIKVFLAEIKRKTSFSLPNNREEFDQLLALFFASVQQKRTEVIQKEHL